MNKLSQQSSMSCFQSCSLTRPVAAVAERPEEVGKEGAGGKGGDGEEASEHCAPGSAPPPQPTAGARQDRPADRKQPGTSHLSPAAAQPESARHPAGSQEGYPTQVSIICYL